jgi:hypothetical protein
MFEKEAVEYAEGMAKYYESAHNSVPSQFEKYLRNAVEYGYNKALKETWHYTSKGDFPKNEGSYYVAMDNGRGYKSGAILNWVEETDCEEDFHWEDDDYECYDEQVYAWKECPTLPPKESK